MDSHGWGFPGGISATRGKVVGGCSAINGCGILAGLDADYNAWSEHAPEWSAASLAPYLERAERTIGAHAGAGAALGTVALGPLWEAAPALAAVSLRLDLLRIGFFASSSCCRSDYSRPF